MHNHIPNLKCSSKLCKKKDIKDLKIEEELFGKLLNVTNRFEQMSWFLKVNVIYIESMSKDTYITY